MLEQDLIFTTQTTVAYMVLDHQPTVITANLDMSLWYLLIQNSFLFRYYFNMLDQISPDIKWRRESKLLFCSIFPKHDLGPPFIYSLVIIQLGNCLVVIYHMIEQLAPILQQLVSD